MTLGDKQRLLGRLLPHLLIFILSEGFSYRIAFAKRCEDCKVGKKNSNHKRMLAIDIDLFRPDGSYVMDTDTHLPIGEFWENLHPLCRWGGHFMDGNHYSLEHDGVI